jgi:hypothetical protein
MGPPFSRETSREDRELPLTRRAERPRASIRHRVSFPDQAQAVLAARLLPARDRTREAETIVEALPRRARPGGSATGRAGRVSDGSDELARARPSVVALVAILSRAERAILVWAALLPFLMAVVFLFAEFLIGHEQVGPWKTRRL